MAIYGITSKALDYIIYDEEKRELVIKFDFRGMWEYHDVPPEAVDALVKSIEPGRYFNREIRLKFDYVRLTR